MPLFESDLKMVANQEQKYPHDADLTTEDTKYSRILHESFRSLIRQKINNKLIEHFLPMYFVNVMATGISSAILYNFPFPAAWLRVCGIVLWGVGIFYFLADSFFLVVSCIKYPENRLKFHTDPALAPFMGGFVMGYNSLVNFLYFLTGSSWIIGVFVLWWISVFLCCYTSLIIFYFTFLAKTKKTPSMDPKAINPTLLLPIVALTVTSSAGNLMVPDLPNFKLKLLTVLISYILWANAMAMSFIVLTLIIYRYIVHKTPDSGAVFTTFIPIGFLGQGAFSILLCGKNIHDITLLNVEKFYHLPFVTDTVNATAFASIVANLVLFGCSISGLFLISFGYFNTFIAVITVVTKIFTRNPNPKHICNFESGWKRHFNGCMKFHKGFWAMTFPLGTMAISNSELGKLYDLQVFKVIGALYGLATVIITIGCCFGFFYRLAKDFLECTNNSPKQIIN